MLHEALWLSGRRKECGFRMCSTSSSRAGLPRAPATAASVAWCNAIVRTRKESVTRETCRPKKRDGSQGQQRSRLERQLRTLFTEAKLKIPHFTAATALANVSRIRS